MGLLIAADLLRTTSRLNSVGLDFGLYLRGFYVATCVLTYEIAPMAGKHLGPATGKL